MAIFPYVMQKTEPPLFKNFQAQVLTLHSVLDS
jgi:hypothetical protein